LRCLLNNLDPDVAEDAAALVVYGGRGRAARSAEALVDIVAALERLGPEETLIVQSGKAVAVLPTHADAPRVLISTAMVVPAWSDEESFRSLEDAGLTMYGQMTAAGWFYIGTQGILGFTYETFRAIGAARFGGTLAGKRVLTAGLGGMGGAQGFAVTRNGGRALVVEVDSRRAERRLRDGWVDLVAGYDEALAAHLDPEGPGTVALVGNAADVLPRLLADGVDFDVVTDQTAAHDPLRGYVPRGFSAEQAGEADLDDPAFRSAVFDSLAAHVEAMLGFRERGAIVFDMETASVRRPPPTEWRRPFRYRGSWPRMCDRSSPGASDRSAGSVSVATPRTCGGAKTLSWRWSAPTRFAPGSSWRVNAFPCKGYPRASAGWASGNATGWPSR
jgi:urocanate hydratase